MNEAAKFGHMKIVKYLVSKGDIAKFPKYLLHFPAERGDLEMLNFLVENGAHSLIENENEDLQTPIVTAASNGHLNIVKYLVSKGADTECLIDPPLDDDEDNLRSYSPLWAACSENHFEIVHYLVSIDPDALLQRSYLHDSLPIETAVSNGNLSIVKLLVSEQKLEKNPDVLNSLIQLATHSNRLEILKYLIDDLGFEPENFILSFSFASPKLEVLKYFVSIRCNSDWLPVLVSACEAGNLEIVRYLIELSCDSALPISFPQIISKGHFEILKYLISIGYNIKDHRACLHAAVNHNKFEILKYLNSIGFEFSKQYQEDSDYLIIETNGEKFDERQMNAVQICVILGHLEILKYLIEELKFDFSKSHKVSGKSLVMFACEFDQLEILKYLIEQLKCDYQSVNEFDGTNLLQYARPHPRILRYLIFECFGKKQQLQNPHEELLRIIVPANFLELVNVILDEKVKISTQSLQEKLTKTEEKLMKTEEKLSEVQRELESFDVRQHKKQKLIK